MYAPTMLLYIVDPDGTIFNPRMQLICDLLGGLIVIVDPLLIIFCYKNLRNEIIDIFRSIYLHHLHP